LFGSGDANCGDSGGKKGQKGGDSHACQEAIGDMQNNSQMTSTYLKAITQGNISNVLQDGIRQRVIAAMPEQQRHIYDQEEQRYGSEAATRGPAHIALNRSVDHAETMILSQAVRQGALGRVQNVELAVKLLQNPKDATPQQWVQLGITVGSHGMMPPEISAKLSRSLTDESGRFFNGTGPGTFAALQVNLKAEMVAMHPQMEKLNAEAVQAGQTGKKALFGAGNWIKSNVVDKVTKPKDE
jgi:hypothetical protein